VVVTSDSYAVLTSLKCCHSRSREDLIYEVLQALFRMYQKQMAVHFVSVPAHVSVDGNEKADGAAKRALKSGRNIVNLKISKTEAKVFKGQG